MHRIIIINNSEHGPTKRLIVAVNVVIVTEDAYMPGQKQKVWGGRPDDGVWLGLELEELLELILHGDVVGGGHSGAGEQKVFQKMMMMMVMVNLLQSPKWESLACCGSMCMASSHTSVFRMVNFKSTIFLREKQRFCPFY